MTDVDSHDEAHDGAEGAEREPGAPGPLRIFTGIVLMTGLALVAAGSSLLISRYRIYQVSSLAMANTLLPGDRIVGDASPAGRTGVARGDIVVIDTSAWLAAEAAGRPTVRPGGPAPPPVDMPEPSRIVRVIGVGGDTVSCCNAEGRLQLNGTPVHEGYLQWDEPASASEFAVRVPEGYLFLLGDNRSVAVDSRAFVDRGVGVLPESAVQARVVAVAYPFEWMGVLQLPAAFSPEDRATPVAGSGTLLWLVGAVALGLLLTGLTAVLILTIRVLGLLRAARRPPPDAVSP